MNVQFLPGHGMQVPRPFLTQYLPGYLQHGRGAVHFTKDFHVRHGGGSWTAASILQQHHEELHYYGSSQALSISLEKLWKKYVRHRLRYDAGHPRAPFASIFVDLALYLSPDGEVSSDYAWRTMSNFFLRHFDEMLDFSPHLTLICFNALDWMAHDMADVCAIVGQELSFLQEWEDFVTPFPFREHTLELLDEVRGRHVPYRRTADPWHPFGHSSGRAIYGPRPPRLVYPDRPLNHSLQLPWHGDYNDPLGGSLHDFPVANRRPRLLTLGPRYHDGNGEFELARYHRRPYRLIR